MTLRSDLVDALEVAITDEAYDGSFGPQSEEQYSRMVRRIAEVAAETLASTEEAEPQAVTCDGGGEVSGMWAATSVIEFAEAALGTPLVPWQRAYLEKLGIA